MLTQVGKFLRQMRMNNNEILKEMATKLDVTSAFLSAVENGKKKMPKSMRNKIVKNMICLKRTSKHWIMRFLVMDSNIFKESSCGFRNDITPLM